MTQKLRNYIMNKNAIFALLLMATALQGMNQEKKKFTFDDGSMAQQFNIKQFIGWKGEHTVILSSNIEGVTITPIIIESTEKQTLDASCSRVFPANGNPFPNGSDANNVEKQLLLGASYQDFMQSKQGQLEQLRVAQLRLAAMNKELRSNIHTLRKLQKSTSISSKTHSKNDKPLQVTPSPVMRGWVKKENDLELLLGREQRDALQKYHANLKPLCVLERNEGIDAQQSSFIPLLLDQDLRGKVKECYRYVVSDNVWALVLVQQDGMVRTLFEKYEGLNDARLNIAKKPDDPNFYEGIDGNHDTSSFQTAKTKLPDYDRKADLLSGVLKKFLAEREQK